ncbi:MAG: hypothetical protein P1U58_00580 [Verrucomicrobiales bacterium]|nr:hypothetical protein [Verrucomicrobiales bacterium]
MNFFPVAIFSFTAIAGSLIAEEEKTTATPNPANAGFPSHWSASSWDNENGATFWTSPGPSQKEKKSSMKPISQPPQPNDFFDRQSEK